MKRVLMLLASWSLAACSLNTQPDDHPTDPATETFASALNVNISAMTKTTNGVYIKDLIVGAGATLTTATTITMSYGEFVKTGAIAGTGDHVAIAVTSMPPGLQEGMVGMKVGSERLIVIPSALGYGNTSVGSVPPNSTLIFDIILYSFQ